MKTFIAAYGLLYLGLLLGWRAYRVRKRTGINPLMLKATDDVGGFVVQTCKRLCVCMVLAGVLYCAAEDSLYTYLFPIRPLERSVPIRWTGAILCVASLVWVSIAQVQMGSSWRVGIDKWNRTALVKTGLYRFSRNPIFVGMIMSFVGVFLIMPSAFLLALVSAMVCLLQVQVRLEEDHLRRQHGEEYDEFLRHVPRWVGTSRLRRVSSLPIGAQKDTCAPVTSTLP